jgi:hypothetical protein
MSRLCGFKPGGDSGGIGRKCRWARTRLSGSPGDRFGADVFHQGGARETSAGRSFDCLPSTTYGSTNTTVGSVAFSYRATFVPQARHRDVPTRGFAERWCVSANVSSALVGKDMPRLG